MENGSLCIINAYVDVFKFFGYSKGKKRQEYCRFFPYGNYLFVFAVIFSLSTRICQANITDFEKTKSVYHLIIYVLIVF